MLKSSLEIEKRNAEIQSAYAQEKPQEKNIGATFGDFGMSIVHGAAKGLEGLFDAGAGLVGWIGGLFDSDFKKNVGDFISRDLTREVGIGTALEDVRKRSYLSDSGVGSFVQDVAGGVGQMLPAVAVSLVSGGTLAPQAFGSIIASAGGGGMEEALNDGASYDRALGYGVLQSATEGALEAVTGGAGRFAAMTGKKAVASVGKTILKEAASETFEEGASALINPLSKSVYKGKSALEEYKNPEFYVDAVKQAAVGGAVGGLMASGSLGISRARAGGKASYNLAALNAEITDTNKALAAIRAESEGMGTAVNKLKKVGKFSAKAEQNYLKYQQELYDAFDKRIAEATPEQQSKYLKKVGRLPLGYAEENGRIVKTEARAVDVASYNRNAYSASLRGREGYLEYQPVKDASRYDTIGMIKEYIEAVNEKGGAELNFVITDETKGAYDATHGVMYLKPDAEAPEVISSTFIHELTHFTEGTESYSKYVKFLDEFLKDPELYDRFVARGNDAYIGGVEQLKKNIGNEYLKGGSIDTIEKNALVNSETVAEITSRIFSDEGAVERLVSKNRGLGARIKQWLTDKIELLKARKNDPVRYKSLKFLEKARKLFDAALRNSVGGVTGIKFSKNIDEYPYDMQTVIKNYIDYKHEELFELAENVREKDFSHKRVNLGKVKESVVKYAKEKTGIDISEYVHAINTSAVQHIERRHGINGEQDKSMSHLEDVARIPYILENYDEITFDISKNGKYETNDQGNPLLFYSKKINGTIYVVEAIMENKHKKLWVQTAYINKRGLRKRFDADNVPSKLTSKTVLASRLKGLHRDSDADNNVSPKITSENAPTSRLSNNSISDNSEKSNIDDKKTLQYAREFKRAPKNYKLYGIDERYFSKREARKIVLDVVAEKLNIDEFSGEIDSGNLAEVAYEFYKIFNSREKGGDMAAAFKAAEAVMSVSVWQNISEGWAERKYDAASTLSVLRNYLHSFDLKGIKEEIKAKGDNSLYLKWAKSEGGVAIDTVPALLAEDGIFIEATNPADILFEIDELYRNSKKIASEQLGEAINDALTAEQRKAVQQALVKEFLIAFAERGTLTKSGREMLSLQTKIDSLTKQLKSAARYNSLIGQGVYEAKRIADIGKMQGVGAIFTENFKSIAKQLGKVAYKEGINKSSVRRIISELGNWYNAQNELIADYLDPDVLEAIEYIRSSDKITASLTMEELSAVVTALRGVRNLFNTYQKVWKNGKLVEARPIVEKALTDLDKRARKVKGFFGTLREKIKGFVGLVADPLTVTRMCDGYNEDGVFTSCYNELQKGIVSAQALEIELKQSLIDFIEDTKGYKKRLISETFDWNGEKIPVGVGLSLYLTARRAHAADGLRESGFGYRDASKKWVDCGTVDSVDALVSQFSQADCDFIRLAEQVLLRCKEIKRGVDMQLKGISNVTDDFYYPIRRHDSKGLSFDDNYNNVVNAAANQSFNKEIVKGAKGMLEIGNVFDVLTDHVRGVAKYAGLAIPVDTMTKVLNMKIDGKASVITTANDKFWNGSENYFKKLVADAQSVKRGEGDGKIVEKMRKGFVLSTFGLNVRSWVGQYAGLAMAGVYIDPDCLLKASATVAHLKRDGELMNKYSAAAMVRDSENYVVRAQGAIDQIGKVGEVLSKPMQLVDRHMTIVMFNAARYQVEKMHKGDASYAYGTEKNATAASEILDRVLLETQSNYMIAARSELQRKSGFVYKVITQFSSDAVKMLSRMVDAVGWLTAAKRRLSEAKLSGNTAEVAKLNAELKRAKKFAVRVFSSVVVSNVAFVLLGMLINYGLLARDKDDDESYAEIFGEGMLGSLFGLVPVAREVYGFFADGYEINNFLQDGVNNALTATQKLANLIDDAVNGRPIENEEIMSTFRKSMYAIGQVFGIPFKNLNKLIYGLTKRFSPAAAYKYNSLFYKGSYTKDLSRAIEAGDEKLASTVLDMMMTSRGIGKASAARAEIIRLYETGNKVLPRAVGNTVTYKEESRDLSAKELKDFKEIYAESDEVVERLVKSNSYSALDDDAKAKAIKFVYDYYYKKALARFFDGAQGVTAEYETLVPIDAVAAVVAYHRTLKGSDKKEKIIAYINRLNLRAAQKYILIGILGYKNLNGESTVRTYLSSLKLPSASSALSIAGY